MRSVCRLGFRLVLLSGICLHAECTDAKGGSESGPSASRAGAGSGGNAAFAPEHGATTGGAALSQSPIDSGGGGAIAKVGDASVGAGTASVTGARGGGAVVAPPDDGGMTADREADGGRDWMSDTVDRTDRGAPEKTDAAAENHSTEHRTCGNGQVRRGKTQRSLTVAGTNRTYLVHEPENLDASLPVPLVFVHHGFTMSGQAMYDLTQYSSLADREKFVVAFPDGEPLSIGPWNVGDGVCGAGALVAATGDDFAFLDAMMDEIAAGQCIDRSHVFVTGFSMGGYYSHHVGCMRPDVAAVAPHSGATHAFGGCSSGPKPVIIFHGTADPLITQSCDDTARTEWVAHNGCSSETESKVVKGGHCEWSKGCPAHGQVVYCLFDDMGHAWAGGASGQTYSASDYESATELSWSFFKNYAF